MKLFNVFVLLALCSVLIVGSYKLGTETATAKNFLLVRIFNIGCFVGSVKYAPLETVTNDCVANSKKFMEVLNEI